MDKNIWYNMYNIGVARTDPGGTRVRGEPHLLMVGDPGTGKSQILKYASKLCPRSVLTTGIGSSSAGRIQRGLKENKLSYLLNYLRFNCRGYQRWWWVASWGWGPCLGRWRSLLYRRIQLYPRVRQDLYTRGNGAAKFVRGQGWSGVPATDTMLYYCSNESQGPIWQGSGTLLLSPHNFYCALHCWPAEGLFLLRLSRPYNRTVTS